MSLRRAQPQERFLSLQRDLLRKGALYEDRDFPPIFRSLFTKTRPSVSLQWKRPKDICKTEPKFFTKGISRSGIAQGRMLNCCNANADNMDPDEDDDEHHCSIVISLMRTDRKRTPANDKPPIGFAIYKVPDDMKDNKTRFDRRFFETTKAQAMTNSFTKLREVSSRYSLPPGEYVIVPSTFYPRQEAEYLLRIFSEKPHEARMAMEDFQSNFTRIEICMLTADSILEPDERRSWKIQREKGRWQTDASAGGCRNFIDTFHINPQIRIRLQDPDEDDDEHRCSMVISLMRTDRKRTPANDKPPIGFAIYKVPDDMKDNKTRFDRRFFETTKAQAMTNSFTKLREISSRYSLPPGEYVIVPSTFYPRQEAEYLLRIFSEKPHEAREVDVETKIMRLVQVYSFIHNAKSLVVSQDGEVDQYELQEILSQAFATIMNSNPFSLEACRSMIAMFDKDKTGALGYSEFRGLWTILGMWKETFHVYDKDKSGDMNLYELRDALTHLGYQLSNNALSSIILRYHNKKGTVPFDIFIQILVRVIVMFDTFRSHVTKRGGRTDRAVFTIDDFIESTLTV
ncbi:PREDICTED: calpain-B-like [Acropora digitifera]|uniref:calpain-B-like n=1 Tax=Acropora digitifera TaxID=70779 RepID=UPI00077A9CF2|nr:PREDICTED: calpain-B-like [Acropora digitifera]